MNDILIQGFITLIEVAVGVAFFVRGYYFLTDIVSNYLGSKICKIPKRNEKKV